MNGGVQFKKLHIFSTCLNQQFYKDFKQICEKIQGKDKDKFVRFYFKINSLDDVNRCHPGSLVVFDDCELVKPQRIIMDYYSRGRNNNISCIYLATSYTKVNKQLIRENLNFLCIFKQFKYYTKVIWEEYASSDFTFERFDEICLECWIDDFGFLTINIEKQLKDGRYMKKFEKTFLK